MWRKFVHYFQRDTVCRPNATDNNGRCLQDMPYEILYEIFCKLSRDELMKISKLCLRFRNVAEDKRFWKNVHIKYQPFYGTLDFEDLYSIPVEVVDLSIPMRINPPVSSNTGQAVKVVTLDLSGITAEKVTIEAILTKYQCTELKLNYASFSVAPRVFLKQTALEVLSFKNIWDSSSENPSVIQNQFHVWLGSVLRNCKNLKTLNLLDNHFTNFGMSVVAKNVPASLEKLNLPLDLSDGDRHEDDLFPGDSFFELLVESAPNLRDLELDSETVKCSSSLIKFQFLDTLRVWPHTNLCIDDFYMYLIQFPALKTVYINFPFLYITLSNDKIVTKFKDMYRIMYKIKMLQRMLKPHNITVIPILELEDTENCNIWEVIKA